METLEQDRVRAELAIRAANAARAFYKFFRENPAYNSQANEMMIRTHLENQEVTVNSIRESVTYLEAFHAGTLTKKTLSRVLSDEEKRRQQEQLDAEAAQQKAQADEAKERVSLWNEISRLLKVSDGMKDGEFKKYQLKDQKGNFIHPTSAMRERLEMLQATSVFRGTSTTQLKEHLRNSRPAPTEFPALPAEYTAMKIRLMPAEALRKLINRYSSAAVTKRLHEVEE